MVTRRSGLTTIQESISWSSMDAGPISAPAVPAARAARLSESGRLNATTPAPLVERGRGDGAMARVLSVSTPPSA
jgi:hypothetical protein